MKHALRSYRLSLQNILKYWKVIVLLFMVNFSYAYLVGAPFIRALRNHTEFTNFWDNLPTYNVYGILEFFNNYGNSFYILTRITVTSILLYVFISVLSNAGILYAVMNQDKRVNIRSFLRGSWHYSWKIFRLSLYFIVGVGLIGLLSWLILKSLGVNILELENDREFARHIGLGVIFFVLGSMILFIIKLYAKINIATDGRSIIVPAIWNSVGWSLRHVFIVIFLFLVNVFVLGLFLLLFHFLEQSIPAQNWIPIFILAQISLIIKIIFRIVHLESAYELKKAVDLS